MSPLGVITAGSRDLSGFELKLEFPVSASTRSVWISRPLLVLSVCLAPHPLARIASESSAFSPKITSTPASLQRSKATCETLASSPPTLSSSF